jgi:hypothetical protein
MKVYLTAFGGKLVSAAPWDWPEHTPPTIRLVLDMDGPQVFATDGTETVPNIPQHKLATFTWNGKYAGSGEHTGARIYVLTDVS